MACCNVFCPNTTIPCPGKVAIGLTLEVYKSSLCVLDNFFSAFTTLGIPPLVNPAGANQGAAILSFLENTPGITTDGGHHIFLPNSVLLT